MRLEEEGIQMDRSIPLTVGGVCAAGWGADTDRPFCRNVRAQHPVGPRSAGATCLKPTEAKHAMRRKIQPFLSGPGVSVLCLAVTLFATSGMAQVSFMGLGDLPGSVRSGANDVSGNGATVVGLDEGTSVQGFRWTPSQGMVRLGTLSGRYNDVSQATGASALGSVVVGFSGIGGYLPPDGLVVYTEAFRWTDAGGMVGLGDLPGGFVESCANGVSADGSVVVGWSKSGAGAEAFRWTQSGGMVGLGDLPGGEFLSIGKGVSANGSVVVGWSDTSSGTEAFRWTPSGGMVGLGSLLGGSQAYDISGDGSVVVGGAGGEAFRWAESEGMVGLGVLGDGMFDTSVALGVSADGSVVIGQNSFLTEAQEERGGRLEYSHEPFIWDALNGMRPLPQVLSNDFGLDLSGWTLNWASGVSDDGLTIVGSGTNPSGEGEAWMAILDIACSDGLDNDGDGLIDYPDDPGCINDDDLSERSPDLVCDDGDDNDGDSFTDYPYDPGCRNPEWTREDPQCQDGINNDPNQDDLIDFDGGLSALGYVATNPDPECLDRPWRKIEARAGGCGLGVELALLLPLLIWMRQRRRRHLLGPSLRARPWLDRPQPGR
jgi:probable HAF family extracellular repeat protein